MRITLGRSFMDIRDHLSWAQQNAGNFAQKPEISFTGV